MAKRFGKGKKGMVIGWPWMMGTAGGGGTETTVTGVSPLLLAAALHKPLKSLTQYGKVAQASTPSGSNVPIVCNNGELRMVDDELPAEYKRVLGFSCNNNAMWEITGFKLKGSDTVRISFSIDGACNVFGCYQGADANDNYDLYVSTTSGSKYFRYGNGTYLSYWSPANLGQRFDVVYTPNGSQGMPQDSTWSPLTFTAANDLLIGATTFTGSSAKMKGSFYGNFVVDGRLKLIPCERVSDGVLGYYDTYSETFYEPYTGYDGAVSLGYDGSHYSLAVVGTDEVISLAPVGAITQKAVPAPDAPVPVVGTPCGDEVLYGIGNDRDSIDVATQTITRVIGKRTLTGTESYGSSSAYGTAWYISAASASWGADKMKAVVCTHFEGKPTATSQQANHTCFFNSSGHFYFRANEFESASEFKAWVKKQYDDGDPVVVYFVRSSSTTEAYTGTPIGQTATAPDLYAVGNYADEVDIISGAVTRKVGMLVLDGTETWSTSSGIFYIRVSATVTGYGRQAVVSTHYVGTDETNANMPDKSMKTANNSGSTYLQLYCKDTSCANATEFKAFLAAQYAAGTPVIVIYPLAEPTTEQTDPQTMSTAKGDNVLSWTAAVEGKTMDVTYMKESA